LSITAAGVFAAGQNDKAGPAVETKEIKNVTVSFMTIVYTGTPVDYLEILAKNFKKEGITIDYQPVVGSAADYSQKFTTMSAGGVYPDVIYEPTIWSKRHGVMGIAYDITDILDKEIKDDFLESPFNTAVYNGRLIGLPFVSDATGIFYNKDMIEKAGIRMPQSPNEAWTWDQLIDAAKTAQRVNGSRYGITIESDFQAILPFLWQTGGTVLNEAQDKTTINQPPTIKMLNWFRNEWLNTGLCSAEVFLGVDNGINLFSQGETPFVVVGMGMVATYLKTIQDFEFGITYMPKDKTRATKIGGSNMEVINKTKNPKEAFEFLKYIVDTPQMNFYCSNAGSFPTRKSSVKTIDFGNIAPYAKICMDEIAGIPVFATNDCVTPLYAGYKGLLSAEFREFLITPSRSPEQTAKRMEDALNQALFK
jgi:ABC-type glycerol-3-phosphate transport system substrate-binding protein